MPCPRTKHNLAQPGIELATFWLLARFPHPSATWLPYVVSTYTMGCTNCQCYIKDSNTLNQPHTLGVQDFSQDAVCQGECRMDGPRSKGTRQDSRTTDFTDEFLTDEQNKWQNSTNHKDQNLKTDVQTRHRNTKRMSQRSVESEHKRSPYQRDRKTPTEHNWVKYCF